MTRRSIEEDEGFAETVTLIISLQPNQWHKRKTQALEFLVGGPAWVAHHRVLSAILERLGRDNGIAWPSIARIARDIGYSKRHVMRSVSWLRQNGHLLRRQQLSPYGDRTASVYTVPTMVGTPCRLVRRRQRSRATDVLTRMDTHVPTSRHQSPHGVWTPAAHRTLESGNQDHRTPATNQTSADHDRFAGPKGPGAWQ